MKSKQMVYLLGFLVLAVWGLIIYRIYLTVQDGNGDILQGVVSTAEKKIKLPKLYPDTFKLLLDYPDPFTGEILQVRDSVVHKATSKNIRVLVQPAAAPQNPVQQIKYLGFVADGKGNRRIAITSYQGAEKMMKEGDTLHQIKILRIKKDQIAVKYKGRITLIKTE